MGETDYARLPVLGQLGGLNQDTWSGSIADNETSDERNIDHSVSGEWKTRAGSSYVGQISTTTPSLTYHWHCDEAADGAIDDVDDEVCTGNLDANNITVSTTTFRPDSTESDALHPAAPTDDDAYAKFQTASNIAIGEGYMEFYVRFVSSQVDNPKVADFLPSKAVYLFYGDADFNICIDATNGDINWKLTSATTITDSTTELRINTWYKMAFQWDYTANEFYIYVDDVLTKSDTTSLVAPTLDANMYFLNNASEDSSPCTTNWPILDGLCVILDDIYIYDDVWTPAKITGIFDNVNQERLIITAADKVFRTTSFTEVTGGSATIVTDTRKDGVEWQGNFYLTTGDTDDGEGIQKITGAGTTKADLANSPGGTKYLASYHNHIFAGGITATPHAVRYTEFDDDDVWTTVSETHIGQINLEDTVMGMHPYAGQLIVGTKNSIQAISGYIRADMVKTVIDPTVGVASHWSMKGATLEGSSQILLWAGYDGIYVMAGGQVVKASRRIQAYWDTLNAGDIEEAHAEINQDKGEYMLAVSTGSETDHDEVIVYNYLKNTFTIFTYPQEMDVLGSYRASGVRYIYGGNATGHIYRLDTGARDGHKEINAYVYTKWYDMKAPDIDKDWRYLWVLYKETGNYEMRVGWENNWVESDSFDNIANEETVDLDPGSAVYGTAVWGTDTYSRASSVKRNEIHLHTDEARGASVRFRFRNNPTNSGASWNLKGFVKIYTGVEEIPG